MNCEDCAHEKVCEGYSNCEEAGLFEPKRPHGEWIYKDMKGQFCSVCDKQSVWKFNFCPNCGAKMRREGDEK